MLAELLATELAKHFAEVRVHVGAHPAASFAPVHPAWSPIEICDNGDEVTIYFGDFTHVHFGNYDKGLTTQERETRIVADVTTFLGDVFADRIEFFKTQFGGGCRARDSQGKISRRVFGDQAFVWSGPIAR